MKPYKLVQTQYNPTFTRVIEKVEIGEFNSRAAAEDYLKKRDYVYNAKAERWIQSDFTTYPVELVEPDNSLFDIRSFIR